MKKINNKILFVSLIVILSVLLDQVTKMVAYIQKDKIGDVVWVGSPYPAQGVEFVIEIARLLKELKFGIVGTPLPAWRAWYESIKQSSPANVIFTPSVTPNMLGSVLENYRFGIIPRDESLPNNNVALPNKFYEYCATGLILISTGFPEFLKFQQQVGSGVTIYYNDVDKSAEIIRKASRTPETFDPSRLAKIRSISTWEGERKNLEVFIDRVL